MERLEPGRHEDADVVEPAREHEVAGLALQPAGRQADGDRSRRACREDEDGGVEGTSSSAGDASHRPEIRRGFPVAHALTARMGGEDTLGGAHPPARGAEHEAHPLALPRRSRSIQVDQAAREGSLQQRRSPIVAVLEVRRPGDERTREAGARELVVPANGPPGRRAGDARARRGPPLPQRRDGTEGDDRDRGHVPLPLASGSRKASSLGGLVAIDSSSTSTQRPLASST